MQYAQYMQAAQGGSGFPDAIGTGKIDPSTKALVLPSTPLSPIPWSLQPLVTPSSLHPILSSLPPIVIVAIFSITYNSCFSVFSLGQAAVPATDAENVPAVAAAAGGAGM